jgi:hypothetical protein
MKWAEELHYFCEKFISEGYWSENGDFWTFKVVRISPLKPEFSAL